MLALLRRRSFALLWTAGLISIAGNWVLTAALPFFVYERTGSTVATAGMIVAELAPHVVLGTFAGVLVDRWDRRRILVVANLLQAMTVLALLLVSQPGWLWVVYVVAALQATLGSFSAPAETSLIPALVEDEALVPANALNGLNDRLGRLIGLALGGVLLGAGGIVPVIVFDALSFAAAGVLVVGVATPSSARVAVGGLVAEAGRSSATVWHEWREGVGLITRNPSIRVLFVVIGLMTFAGTMLDPLYVAWVHDSLGRGAETYSLLMTTHALAGIGGSLLLGRLAATVPAPALMGWGSIVAGAMALLKFNIPNVLLAFGLSGAGGISSVSSSVGVDTQAQRSVPEPFRGRVFGALGASGALLSLVGAVVGGSGGELIGTVAMLSIASLLVMLSGVVALAALGPRRVRS